MTPESPYLNVDESAVYARFDDCAEPGRAFLEWSRLHGVPRYRRGKRVLFKKTDIDRALEKSTSPQTPDGLRAFPAARRRTAARALKTPRRAAPPPITPAGACVQSLSVKEDGSQEGSESARVISTGRL